MNIDLRYKNLYWELAYAIQEYENKGIIDFEEVNNGVEELIDGAESCLEMINNRRKFNHKDFYRNLLKFANINGWSDYDYQHILELAYNKKFPGKAVIMTTMHDITTKTEGHGRSFDYWDEEIGIDLKIYYTVYANINPNHVYSISEIEQLLDENKIIIMYEEERKLGNENEEYTSEKYQEFETVEDEFFKVNGAYHPYTLKYIYNQIDKKKLLKLFKEHLQHINTELNYATDSKNSEFNTPKANIIISEYHDEFKERGYARRLSKLNNIKL